MGKTRWRRIYWSGKRRFTATEKEHYTALLPAFYEHFRQWHDDEFPKKQEETNESSKANVVDAVFALEKQMAAAPPGKAGKKERSALAKEIMRLKDPQMFAPKGRKKSEEPPVRVAILRGTTASSGAKLVLAESRFGNTALSTFHASTVQNILDFAYARRDGMTEIEYGLMVPNSKIYLLIQACPQFEHGERNAWVPCDLEHFNEIHVEGYEYPRMTAFGIYGNRGNQLSSLRVAFMDIILKSFPGLFSINDYDELMENLQEYGW